ncbi:hypothetical protein [Streptomyces sp. NPDC048581]|uniref:hypothetical protein n=1 Tax=unclassified Streptomyces TaxID=2593676 RepID=UPI00371CCDD8
MADGKPSGVEHPRVLCLLGLEEGGVRGQPRAVPAGDDPARRVGLLGKSALVGILPAAVHDHRLLDALKMVLRQDRGGTPHHLVRGGAAAVGDGEPYGDPAVPALPYDVPPVQARDRAQGCQVFRRPYDVALGVVAGLEPGMGQQAAVRRPGLATPVRVTEVGQEDRTSPAVPRRLPAISESPVTSTAPSWFTSARMSARTPRVSAATAAGTAPETTARALAHAGAVLGPTVLIQAAASGSTPGVVSDLDADHPRSAALYAPAKEPLLAA